MNEEIADLLESAADVLEKDGWVQGEFEYWDDDDDLVGRCAMGALRFAAVSNIDVDDWDDSTFTEEYNQALVSIASLISTPRDVMVSDPGLIIARWNDDEDRTQQEVLDLFRKAAKDQRK